MTHHTLALKASADLHTSNLKRGNVQAVVIGQQQTPTTTLSCLENVESAQVRAYVSDELKVKRQRQAQLAV